MVEDGLNRIKALFTAALGMPPQEREAWLRAECGENTALYAKLMRMLKAHDEDSAFLEQPSIDFAAHGDETADQQPEAIGPYRILQQIGEGGMGVVYLAEQTTPIKRRVALKLIKLGMDTKSVVSRFNAERQALAMLDHPNVARVYEAGATETGRPYFVMEYVAGEPITKFCDAHHLTLAERLDLFTRVCDAIQHAHQKGIIHRDIKPSNVLVTREDGKASPKVIDFGVAKATEQRLTEQTLFTEHGVLIGTPSYMSPEQAELSAIGVDARTDVYSLGVLLYEMIVGVLPFEAETLRRAGYAEIQRIIREVEPSKPSTRFRSLGDDSQQICELRRIDERMMHRVLAGDLDWIAMKAIDKDPARRYASASELAADVRRHLNDEPVIASPPSAAYRTRKFVRRHRGAVIAGVALFVTLIAGIVGTSIGWQRSLAAEAEAAAQAENAKRQAEIATAVNLFLNADLLAAVKPSAEKGKGRDVLMRDVLDAAAERIELAAAEDGRFADKPLVEAAIRETIGTTYLGLGDYEAAEPHLLRARELSIAELGPDALASIRSTVNVGNLYQNAGRQQEAEKLQLAALEASRTHLGDDHPQTRACMNNLAALYILMGRYDKAAPLFEEVLAARRAALGDAHAETLATASNLAVSLTRGNRLAEAEKLLRELLPIARRELPEGDPLLAYFLKNLAEAIARQGRLAEARPIAEEALAIRRRVMGDEHPETLASLHDLAVFSSIEGDWPAAARDFEEVMEVRRRVLGERHSDTISAASNLANACIATQRGEEAERLLTEQLAIARDAYGDDHVITMRVLYLLGWLYMQQDRLAEAETINVRLLDAQRAKLGAEHPQTLGTMESVARGRQLQGRLDEAAETYGELLAILRSALGPSNPTTQRIMRSLVEVHEARGDAPAAKALADELAALATEAAPSP